MRVIARQRSPERATAKELWLASGGKYTSKELAELLHTSDSTVRKWKKIDEWDKLLKIKNKRKKGGQPGNKNACGAGAPKYNQNAIKHGMYSRIYFGDCSDEEKELIENLPDDVYTNLFMEYQALIIKEKRLRDKIAKLDMDIEEKLNTDTVTDIYKPVRKDESECQENNMDADVVLGTKIVRMSTTNERKMKLEALLIQLHGRITKVLDSMKSYNLENKRLTAEDKRYELALMKAKGEFELDIDIESDEDEFE